MPALLVFYALLVLLVLTSAGPMAALEALGWLVGFMIVIIGGVALVGLVMSDSGGSGRSRDGQHPGSTDFGDGG